MQSTDAKPFPLNDFIIKSLILIDNEKTQHEQDPQQFEAYHRVLKMTIRLSINAGRADQIKQILAVHGGDDLKVFAEQYRPGQPQTNPPQESPGSSPDLDLSTSAGIKIVPSP